MSLRTIRKARLLSPLFIALALAVPIAVAVATEPVQLSPRHATLLRCSAAFALVAQRQAAGDPAVLVWPAMAERGQEYFVRAGAEIMDGAGLGRERLGELIRAEATTLAAPDALGAAMPDCLASLDASGL